MKRELDEIIADLQNLRDSVRLTALSRVEGYNFNLSDEEKRVIELSCLGLTTREMAAMLFKSHRTVDNYRQSIMDKLKSRNMTEAVAKLYKSGNMK